MKYLFKAGVVAVLAIVAILMLAGPPEASAQAQLQQKYFLLTGSAGGATNSYVVIPKNGQAAPVVTTLSAISDQAGRIAVFTNGPGIPVTSGASNAVTVSTNSLPGYGTNGFTVGDVVIVQRSNGEAVRALYTTNAGAGLMGLGSGNLGTNAFASGDVIYKANTNFALLANATGSVTNIVGGNPVFGGKYGEPLLIEIITTSAGKLHGVAGYYENPPKPQ